MTPLNIITVEHFLTEDGNILSSSLIRKGTYTRQGKKWIDASQLSETLYMPKSIESKLKKPFGTLYEGPENDTSIAINKLYEELGWEHIDYLEFKIEGNHITIRNKSKEGR